MQYILIKVVRQEKRSDRPWSWIQLAGVNVEMMIEPPKRKALGSHHWQCHEFLQSCSLLVETVVKNMTRKKS